MARIFNSYEKPFVVDEAKLRRIKTLLDEKYGDLQGSPQYQFEANTIGHRNYKFSDIEALLSLDNSKKERLKDLFIVCSHEDPAKARKDDRDRVELHFHGGFDASMCLIVRHESTKLANDLDAVLDEQIGRTVQSGLMWRLAREKWPIAVLAVLAILIGSLIFLAASASSNPLALEASDVAELETILSNSTVSDQDKAASAVLVMANRATMRAKAENQAFGRRLLSERDSVFLFAPLLVIVFSLIYILFTCYPSAVYLWGDAKDWYKALESRRNAVWWVIVASTILGIIGNLFVVSLGRYL